MKLKVVTLRFDDETGGFDDRELVDFVGDEDQPREVLDLSEHFFVHDRRPTWALLLSYRDIPRTGEKKSETRKDWRADLDDRGRQLFDEVRGWRIGLSAVAFVPLWSVRRRGYAAMADERGRSCTCT